MHPTGEMAVWIWRHGVLIEATRQPNMVVDAARAVNALLVSGSFSNNAVTQIGFGSTATPPAAGNTGLSVDAYVKAVDLITYQAPNRIAFSISLGTGEANGLALSEYGLLTGNGALYARLVRGAPLTKDASVSLSAVWTITF